MRCYISLLDSLRLITKQLIIYIVLLRSLIYKTPPLNILLNKDLPLKLKYVLYIATQFTYLLLPYYSYISEALNNPFYKIIV